MLLHARKERGVSHDDVARETRVAKRYVIALETESLSNLPGGLYNRSYLRTYAAYLGLDADRIVHDYDRTVQDQSGSRGSAQTDQIDALRAVIEKKESETGRGKIALGRFAGPLVMSMALIVLAGGVWVGARYLSYPTEMMRAQLSTAEAVVSDTIAKNSDIGSTAAAHALPESQVHVSDSEKRPVQPTSRSINDSGVGTDVVGRELVGRSETFPVGTRIVFWTMVVGGRPGDTIRHAWFHRGRTVATVKLPIQSANWRTHSQRMLGPGADGEWVVEAQDEHGRVLARHAFRSQL